MIDNLPTDIKGRVARLETLFADHIGSSGVDIHEPASRWATGFAKPQDVTRAELKNSDGSTPDLLKAGDGHWYCFSVKNGPLDETISAFFLIDIYTSIGGRRDMRITISADGRSWIRTIHSDAQGGTGWVQTQGEVFKDVKDVTNFNNTGVKGSINLRSISRGIDGFDVFLLIRLDNVTAIGSNSASALYLFGDENKKYLKPNLNFSQAIEDYNKVDLTDRSSGKLIFTESGISLTRPVNATTGTSYRGSYCWHVPLPTT